MKERAIIISGFATVALLLATAGSIIATQTGGAAASQAADRAPASVPLVIRQPERPPLHHVVAHVVERPRLRYLNVRYAPLIEQAAERHDVPPLLIAAITRVESDFDPNELSHKGARGLMQVMPETGARFGVPRSLLFDPERNIAAGTAYLAWLLDRYDNDLDLALAGYNAGEGAVDKYSGIPPYRETQNYVRKVRSAFYELQRTAVTPGG
jgi:soluble lytic murein transglycosylase-like protein